MISTATAKTTSSSASQVRSWYAVATSTGSQLGGPGTGRWLTGWDSDPDFADVADFNGDGTDDLIVADPLTATFAVATSTGGQLGGPGTGAWLTGWGGSPEWAGVGDATGDGRADLIAANPTANSFAVATSTGSQLGGPATGTWLTSWDSSPTWARTGDFNGDGKTDLIEADPIAGTFNVALSDGTRLDAPGSGAWLTGWGGNPQWAEVGDFNGDGMDDLIVNSPTAGGYAVALSDGTSLRASGGGVWFTGWGGAAPSWGGAGDFNGDGKDDLIIAAPTTGTFAVATSTGSQLGGPGTGTWLTGWTTNPDWAGVGDVNGDGRDDFILGTNNQYAVALSDGGHLNGAGFWLSGWTSHPSFGGVADFNGDGKDDLLVGQPGQNWYAVALSSGSALNAPGGGVWLSNWTTSPNWAGVG